MGDDTTRWVQHMSGQGARWKVIEERRGEWRVASCETTYHDLPKSEYQLVPAPPQWEKLPEKEVIISPDRLRLLLPSGQSVQLPRGYRWSIGMPFHSIERKVEP